MSEEEEDDDQVGVQIIKPCLRKEFILRRLRFRAYASDAKQTTWIGGVRRDLMPNSNNFGYCNWRVIELSRSTKSQANFI